MVSNPKIGDVYLMYFSGEYHEQKGCRPGIVFQNNTGNRHSPNIIAIPLTTSIKKMNMPTHVFLPCNETGLRKDTLALCESLHLVSKTKVLKFLTKLDDKTMADITKASLLATGCIQFLDIYELEKTRLASIKLNEDSNYV